MAGFRICVVAAIFLAEQAERPLELEESVFEPALIVAAAYALISVPVALQRRHPAWLGAVEAAVDLSLLGVLVYGSGGAFSDARLAFFALPVVACATQSARTTAIFAVLSPTVYSLAAYLHDPGRLPGEVATAVTTDIYLQGIGVAAVGTAALLERRAEALAERGEEAELLARKLLEAQDSERKRLAYGLHDQPVQLLTVAQRDLGAALEGDEEAAGLVRDNVAQAERSLREVMFELHPYALDDLGLAEAIRTIGERAAQKAGMTVRMETAPLRKTPCNERLFAIARELIANAVKHSHGSELRVGLAEADGALHLEVADDGIGGLQERRGQALREDHLGLVAVHERAESVGGEVRIRSEPGEGTSVRVSIPLPEGAEA